VPPVEINSTPHPASACANSLSPVLSVTLSNARRMVFSPLNALASFRSNPFQTTSRRHAAIVMDPGGTKCA